MLKRSGDIIKDVPEFLYYHFMLYEKEFKKTLPELKVRYGVFRYLFYINLKDNGFIRLQAEFKGRRIDISVDLNSRYFFKDEIDIKTDSEKYAEDVLKRAFNSFYQVYQNQFK